MSDVDEVVDIRGLLTIDVDSELRKLAGAQLQGPWQIPAEAVRRALRSGSKQVDVRMLRSTVTISDDGSGISGEALGWTATLLDRSRSAGERHAALAALEAAGELVLLALAGLRFRRLRVESTHAGERWTLEVRAGTKPSLSRGRDQTSRGVELTLSSNELDRRQCVEWIASAARFAPATVRVDEKEVTRDFDHVLATASLRRPLRGRVALTLQGEVAHVWLLEHGVVTGHVTLADTPPFEAAVEMGSRAHDLNAARLRDLLSRDVETLTDQMIDLLVELGRHPAARAEPVRARVARLVLEAARRQLRLADILTLPVFRAMIEGVPTSLDLASLRRAVQRDGSGAHVLTALYPSQRPERFALGSGCVLVADPIERSRLAELMKVRFRPPSPRTARYSLMSVLRRGVDRSRRACARGLEILRHPLRRPALADEILEPDERALVRALRANLAGSIQGVHMCAGRGPIRYVGRAPPQLLLPRDNDDVQASVSSYARDPAWLYPIALTLLGGQTLPPRPLRAQWLSRTQ